MHNSEVVANELEPVLVEKGLFGNCIFRDILEAIHIGIDDFVLRDLLMNAVLNNFLNVLDEFLNNIKEFL